MNSVKARIYKLILGLTSAVTILLMFPVSLSASHFRYGTMSWENPWDNGTIRLNLQSGWRTAYRARYTPAGTMSASDISINWGDGSSAQTVAMKILSVDSNEGSSIAEIGDNSSGTWETGVLHTYADNGTYIIYWTSGDRIDDIENMADDSAWRIETKVNIGGSFTGNVSPVSAVPPIVQIQDNTTFNYQLVSTDANRDTLGYRWGTWNEFVDNTSSTYSKPTGMTLSSSGLVTWNISDSGGQATDEDDMWLTFIMVEDLDSSSGDNKSYVPIDFFFKIACPECEPPTISGIPSTTQTVVIGDNKTFTFTATAITGAAPTFSVLNPPSDNRSIWSTDNSTSVVNGVNTTTFSVSFAPVSSMDNATYAINIRATDNATMTKDQSLGLKVTSVSNADPTAPTLVSPANGATVVKPVSFQWTKSTDADNDTISYSFYLCTNIGFVGCSGIDVASGLNVIPPFNQNLQDNLISWPRYLEAAPIYQQVSQDLSMIPKWLIMLTAFGMLSILISFSLKNISNRKLVIMLILLIFFFSLNINSCAKSDDATSETASTSDESSSTTDNTTSSSDNTTSSSDSTSTTATTVTINDVTYNTSDVTNNTTYYWKVVASDPKGGSAQSATWSFTVQ